MRSLSATGHASGARVLLAAGALWGLEEALLGISCAAAGRPAWRGSLLAGTAFLFLSGARAAGLSRRGIVGAAAICAAVKLLGMAAGEVTPLLTRAAGPVFAYFLQAALWAAISPRADAPPPWRGLIARGAAAGLLAALLFPAVGLFTGVPACIHAESGRYLSVHFATLTMLAAAASAPLGTAIVLRAQRSPAVRRMVIEPKFALDGLSAAALALTLLLAVWMR